MRGMALAALVGATLACAPALRKPPPVGELGGQPVPPGRSAAQLLEAGHACFARRPDVEAVQRAEAFFLGAAEADPQAVEGLYGAIQARLWRVNHPPADVDRAALATSAVDAGQLCLQRAPQSAACHYGLALALGVQARERHATATQGLKLMVEHLQRAAELDPRFDDAGPQRTLALLLVRAPGWPTGPGDPEGGLAEARKAVSLSPEYAPNALALAEALLATGAKEEGRQWAQRAQALAQAARGNPDAAEWAREAAQLLAKP